MNSFRQIFEEYKVSFLNNNPNVQGKTLKPLYGIINNGEVKTSNLPYILDLGEEVFVICSYRYLVQTCYDQDCFFIYMNKEGVVEDYITKDGWIFKFNGPMTESFRSHPALIISKQNLKMVIPVCPYEIQMSRLWKLYCETKKCSTQKELEFLKELYKRESNIENLIKENAELKYRESLLDERINSYRSLLKKIESLVENTNKNCM